MFKHYLTAAWRNILRNKFLSAINILGLSLGISACLIIFLIARFELGFNDHYPGKERVFRVVSDYNPGTVEEDHNGSIPSGAPFAIRNEISGLEAVAIFHHYSATVSVEEQGKPVKNFAAPSIDQQQGSDIVATGSSYFQIFRNHWVAGTPDILNQPNTVVLTESKAKKYFGEHRPAELLNRILVYNDSLIVKVGGIIKDPVKNTDLFFHDFLSLPTIQKEWTDDSWNGSPVNMQTFVKLADNVQAPQIDAQLAKLVTRKIPPAEKNSMHLRLQPLSDLHLDGRYTDTYTRKAYMPAIYGLMGIALFVLILAIINFITLATTQSLDRAKETGIRKICGSSVNGLVVRFLGETFILTGLALVLAIAGIYPLLYVFKTYIPDGVTFSFFSFSTWIFLVVVFLVTALLAGVYPAKVLSSLKPLTNLKQGGASKWNNRGYFIKGLVVFQFTISIVFIIAAMVTGKQVNYMLHKDLGFRKDAIITIQTNFNQPATKKELLAKKIRQLAEVKAVSVSEGTPLAKLHFFNPLTYHGKEEKSAACILEWGDEHFIPLYDIKILAGRNIQASDSIREFMVNETCARALGFADPEDAIGKMVQTIVPGSIVERPIVGVMSDFHSQSLHEQIMPVVLTTSGDFSRLLNVRLEAAGMEQEHFNACIAKIQKCWKEVYPNDPFEFKFFDDTIRKFYEQEKRTAGLMKIAVMISICISCLGLFAQTTLTARRRTREISIRKVLGIRTGQIIYLLGKDTIKLVLIALALAASVSWYGMNQWLNRFAFRIEMNGWIIAEAGMIALLIAFFTISYRSVKAAFVNPVKALQHE